METSPMTYLSWDSNGLENKMNEEISLEFESSTENVPLVSAVVNNFCSDLGLDKLQTYRIELCVVEACVNVIEHAYKEEPGHKVRLVIRVEKDNKGEKKLLFKLYDRGIPMDLKFLHSPEPEQPTLSEGGRGLLIIKKFMDEVNYYSQNGENVLVMVKKLRRK